MSCSCSTEKIILDNIIQTSNNNITITDEKGVILYSNPEHWTVYGIEPNYLIEKSVYELEKDGILSPSVTAIAIKEKKSVQVMQQTRTGKTIMSTAFPIYNDDGELIHVISYAQDQTEILSLHAQYEQLKNKLKGCQTENEELRLNEGIIYRSKELQQLMKSMHRIADSDASVLLLGESGVGKTMFAKFIHNYSCRKKEAFVEVNCSTIPENLFESEMFGYEPGSFTGAQKYGKQGLIKQAHNGTLFLDEIGELPLTIQVKLLKVLQEKKFTPIGGKKEVHVDFRLVVATNQALEDMVQQGSFRMDLYYRLHVIPLHIPSLRERKEDITLLINHYLKKFNQKYHSLKKLHSSTYEFLLQYDWPGNVRELENLIERLVLTSEEHTIYPNFLPAHMTEQNKSHKNKHSLIHEESDSDSLPLKDALEQVEKSIILKAYHRYKTTYEMANALGISQPSVVRKLKKYKEST